MMPINVREYPLQGTGLTAKHQYIPLGNRSVKDDAYDDKHAKTGYSNWRNRAGKHHENLASRDNCRTIMDLG